LLHLDLSAALVDLCGDRLVGTWYLLDGSEAGFGAKRSRRWIVTDVPTSGPLIQMVPRSTQYRPGCDSLRHQAHCHSADNSDRATCRIDEDGWIVRSRRSGKPRRLLQGLAVYSCMEEDPAVLEALRCAL